MDAAAIQRAMIGGLGGLAAIFAKYYAQDHAYISHWAGMGDDRFKSIVIGYVILTPILVFLGALFAWVSEESNRMKLLALGVAAPAMITTMAGGSSPPPPRIAPPAVGPAGWHFELSPISTAYAQGHTMQVAQVEAIQKGVQSFFGAGKGEQRYWVVAASFRNKNEADAKATEINAESPAMKAFVGNRMPGNEFYPVIVGEYLPQAEADRLRIEAERLRSAAGVYLSAYPDRRPAAGSPPR